MARASAKSIFGMKPDAAHEDVVILRVCHSARSPTKL
ncbi:MAG: hypothetical protein QOF70_229 [Acetobacteraceae bacterium]|jgi:hypothetical protein|nr:hypothetical protein [Acetobacteraceae bacterium]